LERTVNDTSLFDKSVRYRSHAVACGIFAEHAKSPADRELLLRMQSTWLARACHVDWIDGMPPTPPAAAKALAVPRI